MSIEDWSEDIELKAENNCINVYMNGKKINGVTEVGFDSKNGVPIITLTMLGFNTYMHREDGTKLTLKEMIENSNGNTSTD